MLIYGDDDARCDMDLDAPFTILDDDEVDYISSSADSLASDSSDSN